MNEQKAKDLPQSRVKKRSIILKYIAIPIAVLIVIGSYFFIQKYFSPSSTNQKDITAISGEAELAEPTVSQSETAKVEKQSGLEKKTEASSNTADLEDSINEDEHISDLTTSMDISARIEQKLSSGGNHQRLIDEINSFYAHLDQQPYIQNLGLTEPSQVYFSKLLHKVAGNPPIVHGETDDLFTILQNTAHFFRILGKENINILKEVLDQERNSYEYVLKTFYGLTYQPQYLEEKYTITLSPATLTDYAAFFLKTMGGQLYLFRLDSTSRMVATYYAIITIDRANSEGRGGHGIDLRPSVAALIEEIENGGKNLQLKDEYLDVLYDLQEKYNEQGF
jgi:hypothetical protein